MSKKKVRYPCDECGKVRSRNKFYDELNAYLCESCKRTYKKYPLCEKPPIGVMGYDKNRKVICHICGRGGFDKLSPHIKQRHGLTVNEYKDMFGLKRTQNLTSDSFHEYCQLNFNIDMEMKLKNLELYRHNTTFKKGESNKRHISQQERLERESRRETRIKLQEEEKERKRIAKEEQRKIREEELRLKKEAKDKAPKAVSKNYYINKARREAKKREADGLKETN